MNNFGKKWFKKFQKYLIWLLNAPIIRIWFRYVMRIRKYDCTSKIVEITPNSFTYNAKKVGNKVQLTTDFRTHNKFSKRIYYGFKYLWWTLHYWDMLTNKIGLKRLNLGLDSLEVYPDPDHENSTVDGYCNKQSADLTWANLIASDGNFASDNVSPAYCVRIVASTTNNQWAILGRSIFLFDTSSLTSGASISDAVLSICSSAKQDGLSVGPDVNVYSSNPASNTAVSSGDFDTLGTTAYATAIGYSSWATGIGTYNNFTFNATGISAISKTGISKFGIRNANYDVGATAPAWTSGADSRFRFYLSELSGTTSDPRLVVTYSVVLSKRVYGYIF